MAGVSDRRQSVYFSKFLCFFQYLSRIVHSNLKLLSYFGYS